MVHDLALHGETPKSRSQTPKGRHQRRNSVTVCETPTLPTSSAATPKTPSTKTTSTASPKASETFKKMNQPPKLKRFVYRQFFTVLQVACCAKLSSYLGLGWKSKLSRSVKPRLIAKTVKAVMYWFKSFSRLRNLNLNLQLIAIILEQIVRWLN